MFVRWIFDGRTRRYGICALVLLFFCSSVSFYDPIELCPEEGFTKQRTSVDVRHLNVTSPVVTGAIVLYRV